MFLLEGHFPLLDGLCQFHGAAKILDFVKPCLGPSQSSFLTESHYFGICSTPAYDIQIILFFWSDDLKNIQMDLVCPLFHIPCAQVFLLACQSGLGVPHILWDGLCQSHVMVVNFATQCPPASKL